MEKKQRKRKGKEQESYINIKKRERGKRKIRGKKSNEIW